STPGPARVFAAPQSTPAPALKCMPAPVAPGKPLPGPSPQAPGLAAAGSPPPAPASSATGSTAAPAQTPAPAARPAPPRGAPPPPTPLSRVAYSTGVPTPSATLTMPPPPVRSATFWDKPAPVETGATADTGSDRPQERRWLWQRLADRLQGAGSGAPA